MFGSVLGGILASAWRCFGSIFVMFWDVFRGKHEGHIERKNVLMISFDTIVFGIFLNQSLWLLVFLKVF